MAGVWRTGHVTKNAMPLAGLRCFCIALARSLDLLAVKIQCVNKKHFTRRAEGYLYCMSEHILTTEEIDQFISSLQSGEIVLEPIWTEAPADIVYSPIQYVFGPMKDDGAPYFE